jgi:hypothetical protein
MNGIEDSTSIQEEDQPNSPSFSNSPSFTFFRPSKNTSNQKSKPSSEILKTPPVLNSLKFSSQTNKSLSSLVNIFFVRFEQTLSFLHYSKPQICASPGVWMKLKLF